MKLDLCVSKYQSPSNRLRASRGSPTGAKRNSDPCGNRTSSRDLLERLLDGVAVHRAQGDDFEHDQVPV
jgi:hypothetical protein